MFIAMWTVGQLGQLDQLCISGVINLDALDSGRFFHVFPVKFKCLHPHQLQMSAWTWDPKVNYYVKHLVQAREFRFGNFHYTFTDVHCIPMKKLVSIVSTDMKLQPVFSFHCFLRFLCYTSHCFGFVHDFDANHAASRACHRGEDVDGNFSETLSWLVEYQALDFEWAHGGPRVDRHDSLVTRHGSSRIRMW